MTKIQSVADVRQLGTILSIWAHPDDESFCAAGLMAAAAKYGQSVICATATKGEQGSQDPVRWPVESLGDVRAAELRQSLDILGLATHHWLGYQDGGCHEVPENEGAERVGALIERYRPQTILTFPPDGVTGHPDHQAVSGWVSRAVRDLAGQDIRVFQTATTTKQYEQFLRVMDEKINIFYNLDQPNLTPPDGCDIHVALPADIVELKCLALQTMPSQTETLYTLFSPDFLCQAFATEAFVLAPT